MNDDIVARLRMWADDRDIYKKAADEIEKGDRLIDDLRHERNVLQKICAERVAEIERLRAKIQQLNDSAIFINNDWSDAICENFDLREENAELRETAIAALKEIAGHKISGVIPDDYNERSWTLHNYVEIREIARAALGEKTDD